MRKLLSVILTALAMSSCTDHFSPEYVTEELNNDIAFREQFQLDFASDIYWGRLDDSIRVLTAKYDSIHVLSEKIRKKYNSASSLGFSEMNMWELGTSYNTLRDKYSEYSEQMNNLVDEIGDLRAAQDMMNDLDSPDAGGRDFKQYYKSLTLPVVSSVQKVSDKDVLPALYEVYIDDYNAMLTVEKNKEHIYTVVESAW